MTARVQHIPGTTTHARRGAIRHMFRYGVDYVLLDSEAALATPALFSRGGFNLASVHDVDHGGPPSTDGGRPGRAMFWRVQGWTVPGSGFRS